MSHLDFYAIGKIIGEGSYAKIKQAKHIPTDVTVALKILNKDRLDNQ